jgi:hypothetical protein
MVTNAPSVAETEFDVDSFEKQSDAALESLIASLEAEYRDLQLTSFDQRDALAFGLLLVDLATRRQTVVLSRSS